MPAVTVGSLSSTMNERESPSPDMIASCGVHCAEKVSGRKNCATAIDCPAMSVPPLRISASGVGHRQPRLRRVGAEPVVEHVQRVIVIRLSLRREHAGIAHCALHAFVDRTQLRSVQHAVQCQERDRERDRALDQRRTTLRYAGSSAAPERAVVLGARIRPHRNGVPPARERAELVVVDPEHVTVGIGIRLAAVTAEVRDDTNRR